MASVKPNLVEIARDRRAKRSSTVAVNAAFMWEIKSVNEELWKLMDVLHALCKRPHAIMRRRKRLVELLEELQDLVAMQFTLEEAYGYFDDPEHVEASVSRQAISLRNEHSVLYQALIDLVDRAQDCFFTDRTDELLYRIPALFNTFYEQYRAHDERECALTLSAMNDEIGVCD